MSSVNLFFSLCSSRGRGEFIGWFFVVFSVLLELLIIVIMCGVYKVIDLHLLKDRAIYEYAILSIVYLFFNVYFSCLLVNGSKNDNPHHILGWLIYNGAFIIILSFKISVSFILIEWIPKIAVILFLSVWVYLWLSIFSLYQRVAKDNFRPVPSVIYQVPGYQNPQIEKKMETSVIYV